MKRGIIHLYIFKSELASHLPQLRELINQFISKNEYILYGIDDMAWDRYNHNNVVEIAGTDLNTAKISLYLAMMKLGFKPLPWGTLTGIRPVKLYGEIYHKYGEKNAIDKFSNYYHVSMSRLKLSQEIHELQKDIISYDDEKISLYISIPFCPSRCSYCSFTSREKAPDSYAPYLLALKKELSWAKEFLENRRFSSIYIGGGTPTSLSADELDDLLSHVTTLFPIEEIEEFTVEAGRADTITEEKLKIIKKYGCNRISINPQTLKEETLNTIGRKHTVHEFFQAYRMAKKCGFEVINTDLIAGLAGENIEDFCNTIDGILKLDPENVTIHCLSIKRGSKIFEEEGTTAYEHANLVKQMVDYGMNALQGAGYKPYYLYRQKNMKANLENVGYCMPGTESIYNIHIMDEHHSILAVGAKAISKRYFPGENRLERAANVTNYMEYISRIDEMIERKKKLFM